MSTDAKLDEDVTLGLAPIRESSARRRGPSDRQDLEGTPASEEPPARQGAPDYTLDEVLMSVGHRVRRYRKLRGLTLDKLASLTGLSPSMISTVERGQTGVSVATVHALAQALDISITALFQASGPDDPVTKSSEQYRDVLTGGAHRTLAVADPEMRLEFSIYDFDPDTASAKTPSQHNGMEYGILLSGALVVEIDGQEHAMAAGDAVQYSTRARHLMKNVSDQPARAAWINISRL